MKQAERRKILQGLALSLPAIWVKPVVQSITLPAHAAATRCSVPAGCYVTGDDSVMWTGDTGPQLSTFYGDIQCSQDSISNLTVVAAESSEAAAAYLPCNANELVEVPTGISGCNLYFCLF